MGTIISFESRPEKADQARAPMSMGSKPRLRSVRLLAVSSVLYGFTVAAAIEVEAFAPAVLLIIAGALVLRRLR